MAERPSDEWFNRLRWMEHAGCWTKDYDGLTYIFTKLKATIFCCGSELVPKWSRDALDSNDPIALHAAWEAEQKRRETPLDPDGWTHFDGCSVHVEGGYRVTQTQTGARWNAWKAPHENIQCLPSKEIAIAVCNQHARENGVKSC